VTWLKDLFAEPSADRSSLSRFWVNVVMAVSTWIIIRMELTDRTSWEILGTYMGLVLGYEATKRGVRRHYDASIETEKIRRSFTDRGMHDE
jgi:hypothetical protein